ncbi:MAG: hypothetical protein V3T02_01010 [Alphaproteobacteria bacterium]
MKKFVVAISLLLAMPSLAVAQTICINRTDMLDRLAAEFEEHLAEVRMIEDQGLLEILKSSTKGTWTVILTNSSGTSCVIATGEGLPATGTDGSIEDQDA